MKKKTVTVFANKLFIWLFHSKHSDYLYYGHRTPNIIYHLNPYHVNKWKSRKRSINYPVNYRAPLATTAGALFTPNTILLHILSLFKNCCFNYFKQNWKLLRGPLSQNRCIYLFPLGTEHECKSGALWRWHCHLVSAFMQFDLYLKDFHRLLTASDCITVNCKRQHSLLYAILILGKCRRDFLKLGMIYIHKSFGNLVVTGHQYIFTRYNKIMLWKKAQCVIRIIMLNMLVLYSSELWLKTSAWTVHLNSSFPKYLNNVDSWLKLNSVIMCECHIALTTEPLITSI